MKRLTTAAVVAITAAALLFGGAFRDGEAYASPSEARVAALRGYAALDRARVAVEPGR